MARSSRILIVFGIAAALVLAAAGGVWSYGYGHSLGVTLARSADPKSLTVAQLKAELDQPQNFIKKDWSTDWTRTFRFTEVDDADACRLQFDDVDRLAGLKVVVERELHETSTTHQVNQSVGYTPQAAHVVAAEKESLSGCGSSEEFISDKGEPATFAMSTITPASMGVPASDPAVCRTEKATSKDYEWSFSGDYCTIAIGRHVLQVQELTADPDAPVTRVGFGSIVKAESAEVARG
ncbi:hypothetical protein [Frondihabitans australicus]|uniref:Uncharacterized protein n=1 Tax=Frondihabitans australicus TaxID=386892 RepID=A0A495IJX6_9MICO|nr:hypothetical protein [Frondihabitans australicus]RKR76274.1 hypothetical protein C8E83_3440 [Frondihabitans australicus]